MPVPATGLYLESEVYTFVSSHTGEAEICQNYWLHVCTSHERSDSVQGPNETVMYASDIADVERLLSAIVSVCVRHESQGKLAGAYSSYRNYAQMQIDENLSEACYEDLECTVNATKVGGFEVLFHSKADGKVCRFGGVLAPEAVADLQAKFAAYRSEHGKALRAAGAEIDRLKQAAAPEEVASPSP
jgi:hypothetical protein